MVIAFSKQSPASSAQNSRNTLHTSRITRVRYKHLSNTEPLYRRTLVMKFIVQNTPFDYGSTIARNYKSIRHFVCVSITLQVEFSRQFVMCRWDCLARVSSYCSIFVVFVRLPYVRAFMCDRRLRIFASTDTLILSAAVFLCRFVSL